MKILISIILLFSSQLHAAEMTGNIINVISGEEVVMVGPSGGRHYLRLAGIKLKRNDPIMLRAAMKRLQGLTAGRFIRFVTAGNRTTGRLSGKILSGGSNINGRLIAEGLVYFTPDGLSEEDKRVYARQERQAKNNRLGIWRNNR